MEAKEILTTDYGVFSPSRTETLPERTFIIKPKNIARLLASAIALLLIAHITAIFFWSESEKGVHFAAALNKHFNFNNERNIPTFFSGSLLFFSALLCFMVYSSKKRQQLQKVHFWRVLGIVFLCLGLDEVMQIHERVNNSFQSLFPADHTSYVFWPWMILYSALTMAAAAYFFKFLFQLPLKTRRLFILSGAIYVTGALCLEYFEGRFDEIYGLNNMYTRMLIAIEEVCEMSGVTLFIFALLQLMAPLKYEVHLGKERNYISSNDLSNT